MEQLTRRNFVGTVAAVGAAAAAGAACATGAVASEAAAQTTPAEGTEGGWTGTPADRAALGDSTMPLEELNRLRAEYVDSFAEDWTCEDGTVVPSVYVKVAALINTYGFGGYGLSDTVFSDILMNFDEDLAQAYLEMPRGIKFSPIEFAVQSGRPVEECREVCETLFDRGFLCRSYGDTSPQYWQTGFVVGVAEYRMPFLMSDPDYRIATGNDVEAAMGFLGCGTPVDYAVPCDKSIVTDAIVRPYDDIEAVINSKNRFAIAPCFCRYRALREADVEDVPGLGDFADGSLEDYFSPLVNQRVETCLLMGDEADYWIATGTGREITREQALAYIKRSVEDGFVIQSVNTKETESFCSCHGDSCGLLKFWLALGADDPTMVTSTPAWKQVSHYTLNVDLDACIKCGTCAGRCPMHAISMDEETGYPVVGDLCLRCGQCGYVCPAGARTLAARPEEENLDLPECFLDDHNRKAAYRFEHGLIGHEA